MRGKKRARAWWTRDNTWPGKVHRPKKVMTRVATLLAAKRKRDAKLNTPAAVAARKRALSAQIKKAQGLRAQLVRIVDVFTAELQDHAAA